MTLEICCYNLASALIAQESGANRIELCADPSDGGTTPSAGVIKAARKKLNIPLFPIIRARGGDFLFSDEEFQIMVHDVETCKELGCDGIATGILLVNGRVDKARCALLIEKAYPMSVTFHRAFDWADNPFEALEDIISLGCERILSSGQQPTAIQGSQLLAELIRQSDHRIIIMPGSGVRSASIADIARSTGATEFHSSARTQKKSAMEFINLSMAEEPVVVMADGDEVNKMTTILLNL